MEKGVTDMAGDLGVKSPTASSDARCLTPSKTKVVGRLLYTVYRLRRNVVEL